MGTLLFQCVELRYLLYINNTFSDLKGRRGFSAPESDHIKVRPSNGSSSGNRFTPYGRPCNKSNNRSLSPDANKQENIDSKSASSNRHGSRTDDVNKAENVYHIPTQKYTEFEVIPRGTILTNR